MAYGVLDSIPRALALRAVKGADGRAPLLAFVQRVQSEPTRASGSVPCEPEVADIHTEISTPI